LTVVVSTSPGHRDRRRAAFAHAADVHQRSADLHEAAAIVFERSGYPTSAQREKLLAEKEAKAAGADRRRATEQ
jgi:uncharacterized protein involved in exopolysaccharide biosynthesis